MRSPRRTQNRESSAAYSINKTHVNAPSHCEKDCGKNVLNFWDDKSDAAHTMGMPQKKTQSPASIPSGTSRAAGTPTAAIAHGALTISSSQGLANYFHGIAAGDEMSELIRGLRSSMWGCYQECLGPPARAQMLAGSLSARQAAVNVRSNVLEPDELSSCRDEASLMGSQYEGTSTQSRGLAPGAEGSGADLIVSAPTTPTPIPFERLKAADRRQYWLATKAAMLFAVEAPWVAEEATSLHCCPVTRSLLYNYYYPSESHNNTHRKPRLAATLGIPPVMSTLQSGEVRWVLSDVRVVELAKEELKANQCDGSNCGWKRALALLRQVDPTSLTSAVELELYRRTNGYHWAEALKCLWRIDPTHWTEMDVAAAIRCLYFASRRHHHRNQRKGTSPSSGEVAGAAPEKDDICSNSTSVLFHTRLIADALCIHHAVEAAGLLRWSTLSALNDTLGLLAFSRAGWRDACTLLDKLLAGAAADACPLDEEVGRAATRGASDAVPSEKVVRSVQRITSGEEALEADMFLLSTFYERDIASQSDGALARSGLHKRASSPEMLYCQAKANVVTVHQTCRAFRSRWDEGLRYVQLLQGAFADTINLASDTTATEDVLRLCIAGEQWEAALRIVKAHQMSMTDDNEKRHLSSVFDRRGLISAAAKASAAPAAVSSKRVTLPHQRHHYSSDIFLQLVRLFGSVPASRYAAYDLIRRYAAPTSIFSSVAANVNGCPGIMGDLKLSKHYSTDPVSRAYNFLLQSADTLRSAEEVLAHLRRYSSVPLQKSNAVAKGASGCTSSEVYGRLRDADTELAELETESVAHLSYLAAVAGDWCRALRHANTLLHEPRYRATFFPTARLHDAVQYALENAPSPGPSWETSLQLFTDMMERHVPSSEVSFQSVVKRCFAGGVPDQAQRLFHFLLRRGVRS